MTADDPIVTVLKAAIAKDAQAESGLVEARGNLYQALSNARTRKITVDRLKTAAGLGGRQTVYTAVKEKPGREVPGATDEDLLKIVKDAAERWRQARMDRDQARIDLNETVAESYGHTAGKLKAEQLAEVLGISQPAVSQILNGVEVKRKRPAA
jgi:predicted XRE-type DNA-binding protein